MKGTFFGLDTKGYLAAGEKYIDWLLAGRPDSDVIGKLFIVPHYVVSTVVLTGIYRYLHMGASGVVAFNCVLFSLIVCMIFLIWHYVYGILEGQRIAKQAVAVLGGMYLIFGLPDVPLWTYAVLTEIIFLFWVSAFIFFSARGFTHGGWLTWALGLLFAITAPFVRPTGVVVPILYVFALCLYAFPMSDRRFTIITVTSLAVPALAVFVVVPVVILLQLNQSPLADILVPDMVAKRLDHAVYFFANGRVIADRLEWTVGSPLTYLDIVTIMLYRIAYYLVPLRFGAIPYSAVHNAVNVIYMMSVIPLGVLGVWMMIKQSASVKLLLLFLIMVTYSYVLLHAVTLVSYDWRYQLPAMIPLWILAGFGYLHLLGYRVKSPRKDEGH